MYAYNPRKKSPERLESSLVGADRWDILNGILKELALKKGEPPKQHWMIVGARGMGKSHLLTLLHHKVSSDKKLNKIWIPVLFPEEIRMAGDLARFLERAVTEVQCDLERAGSPVAPDLKEKVAKVRSVRHDERVEYLFSILSWVRQATGRHILLIAENLQQLLGKKLSLIEQKKLRAFLQSDESLLLIGSATTVFNALHDHSHPFYHFFHIRRLEDLSFEDVKALVEDLLSNHKKEERSRIVMENEPRLRVLYSFTGGNPRMAVFLSDILKTNVNEEMIEIMDRILDELTPYFEAIINDTPEYLQEIINCLAAYEPAQTPKEIAEHLEMEQGTVRNYLKQAKESGYVRVAFSKGKSNYYCLSEYVYRIWFQMRDSGHREQIQWLVEIMVILYTKEYLFQEQKRMMTSSECNDSYYIVINNACNYLHEKPDIYSRLTSIADSFSNIRNLNMTDQDFTDLIKRYTLNSNDKYEYSLNLKAAISEYVKPFEHEDPDSALFWYLYVIKHELSLLMISEVLADYEKYIAPIITKLDKSQIINMVCSNENISVTSSAILIIAGETAIDFEAICERYTGYDHLDRKEKTLLDMLTYAFLINLLVFAAKDDLSKCIFYVNSFCSLFKNAPRDYKGEIIIRLLTIVISGYKMGVIKQSLASSLFDSSSRLLSSPLKIIWDVLVDPDSVTASKILADKPIRDFISSIQSIVSYAR